MHFCLLWLAGVHRGHTRHPDTFGLDDFDFPSLFASSSVARFQHINQIGATNPNADTRNADIVKKTK